MYRYVSEVTSFFTFSELAPSEYEKKEVELVRHFHFSID